MATPQTAPSIQSKGPNRRPKNPSDPYISRPEDFHVHPTAPDKVSGIRLAPAKNYGAGHDPAEPYEFIPGVDPIPEGPEWQPKNKSGSTSQKFSPMQSLGIGMTAKAGEWADQEQAEQNPYRQSLEALKKIRLPESHDPRDMVAEELDKYLHVGKQLGSVLWIIWGILALLGLPLLLCWRNWHHTNNHI